MRRRRSLGLSLGEVLVVLALSALFLGILVRFFVSATRISNEELERNRTEATLINLAQKLKRDLSVASAAGLSLTPDGRTFLVHPITLSDVGSVVYQDKLILWYYDEPNLQLTRGEALSFSEFTFDGTAYQAPLDLLLTLGGSAEFATSHRFGSISDFKLSTNPDVELPFIGSPIRLEVKAKLSFHRKNKEILLQETIHLRNSGV